MTAKEYLSQAYRIDQRINSKIEQVASLRELSLKATATLTDMPCGSRNVHSKENIIAKMIDLENEINADIDELVDLKREIVTAIKQVENNEYQTLLEQRYLCFKQWEQIAVDMGYSLQHTFRLHDKALKLIKKMRVNVIE
jgi:DNA-directed RNA polymerase specialized sigma subunit